jgi:hypothetical protein
LDEGLTCTMELRLYWPEIAPDVGQTIAAGPVPLSGASAQQRRENQP